MDWIENELRRARGRRVKNMYAQMLVNKCVDVDILGLVYRPDTQIPTATVKRLIKQTRFMEAVSEEVVQILNDKGATKDWLVEFRMDIAEKARKDGRYTEALKAIDKMEDMQEMTPRVEKLVQTDSAQLEYKENKMLSEVKRTRSIERPAQKDKTKALDESCEGDNDSASDD